MRAEPCDNRARGEEETRRSRRREGGRVFHRDCIGVALIISPVAGTSCLRSTRVFLPVLLFRGSV